MPEMMPAMPPPDEPVLLIVADDCGQELLDAAPTPNLDQLAQLAIYFDACWSAPYCSPGRARILSGLEAWRDDGPGKKSLIGRNVDPSESYSLPPSSCWVSTLPGASSLYGKLHVAAHTEHTWPIQAGFATWDGSMGNLGQTGFYNWERVTEAGSSVEEDYATRVVGEAARVALQRGDGLVVVCFQDAHGPYDLPPPDMAPESYQGPLTSDEEVVLAKVEAMDTAIGWLLEEVAASPRWVFFLSDNSSNRKLPFGGQKGKLSNKGLDVPLWVYHPALLTPGGLRHGVVQTTDLAATIMALRGANGSPPIDSVPFLDAILYGGSAPREFIRSDKFRPNGQAPGGDWERGVRDGEWSYYSRPGGEELYYLEVDPDEQSNLMPPKPGSEQEAYDRLTAVLQG